MCNCNDHCNAPDHLRITLLYERQWKNQHYCYNVNIWRNKTKQLAWIQVTSVLMIAVNSKKQNTSSYEYNACYIQKWNMGKFSLIQYPFSIQRDTICNVQIIYYCNRRIFQARTSISLSPFSHSFIEDLFNETLYRKRKSYSLYWPAAVIVIPFPIILPYFMSYTIMCTFINSKRWSNREMICQEDVSVRQWER